MTSTSYETIILMKPWFKETRVLEKKFIGKLGSTKNRVS